MLLSTPTARPIIIKVCTRRWGWKSFFFTDSLFFCCVDRNRLSTSHRGAGTFQELFCVGRLTAAVSVDFVWHPTRARTNNSRHIKEEHPYNIISLFIARVPSLSNKKKKPPSSSYQNDGSEHNRVDYLILFSKSFVLVLICKPTRFFLYI